MSREFDVAVNETVEGIRADDVARAVGAVNAATGARHAAAGSVLYSEWHAAALQLRAVVRGVGSQVFSAILSFDSDDHGGLTLVHGECSCRTGSMCAHVATAALAACPADAPAPATPAWESALDALVSGTETAPPAGGPLAVEVVPAGGRLEARLLRPGSSGWVNGGLTWNRMLLPAAAQEHRPDHLAVVRELYLLHHAARGEGGHSPYRYYGYGSDERRIDLAALTSRRFWALLDEATEVGLAFLPSRHRLGPVEPYRTAQLSLDVTAGPRAALILSPTLRFEDGEPDLDAGPIAFLGGDTAHGVAYISAAERLAAPSARLRWARLDPPVPRAIWQAALDEDAAITVPADQVDRFRERFGGRLAELRSVTSSDGSFAPPEVGSPVLVLRADFTGEHALSLSWEWSYDIDGVDTRVELARRRHTEQFRDGLAEQEALDAVDALPVDWEQFRVHPARDRGTQRFIGLHTAAFATEALPVLEDADGIRVERSGTVADYREVGDEVAIEISTTESDAGNDWFDLGITVAAEGRQIPFVEVFKALARGETHLLLPDGAFFSLEKPEFAALRTLIDESRAMLERPADGQLRISPYQAGWWEELAALGVVTHQAEAWRERVGGLLDPGALDPAAVPASVDAELRPYQQAGFEWLAFLWRHRLGGVLADDMGLGKTLQALALIAHARETAPDAGPVLIVAPTSVVANWTSEAARFAPDLRVVALTDTLKRRGQDLESVVAGADVVVTSYTLFRLDAEAHERIGWSAALFDEAQFLKNRRSKAYACARRVPAAFKLAITGTPMENDLMELWSLLSITAPGLFPNPESFRETYAKPIEKGDADLLARLRRRIRPLVLRRTKEQVAPDLPAKQEQVLPVELAPAHHRLYQRVLQRERQKILQLLGDVDANRISILASITKLRRLALHPALVEEDSAGGSAKIDLLVDQIRDVAGAGHRALVFSQFTGFLAHVRDALDAAGIAYAYLDGSTRDRAAAIEGFKDGDAPVFLISLKAGGFGLNLTEADYCFLLDPWWNPATEAQAIDRTHRIGQDRTVMVYRLISQDTIEEKVRALAQRKAALTTGVMDDEAAFAGSLDADDIRALVS
ncbi:DEAD/DEAH box helicase [Actinomycetospora endophytica]|uniref:DEAD/DEAH box helicase n=1 Tax=Actinomycetospora endophytica TaxID=2291215 RepID=A0ABS8P8X3_9PSEU|nr:DEAD/DEAH box helicase [Actinomycetospora endophytica]MCD2193970.1 DEAD/DEAH box helicase [Actinomycetospora endophytica]